MLVTAYHAVWAAILLRLAVAEAMGEYGPSMWSVIGSVLDIMVVIEWVDVAVELEAKPERRL